MPMQKTWVQTLGWEDPLEKEMTTNSSILAWEISWTGESSKLSFTRSQRVRYDLATKQQQQQVILCLMIIGMKIQFDHH